MVDKVMSRFERFTDEDYSNMDPAEATKVLKELVQMQRVTVGLPAAAPADAHIPGVEKPDASIPIEQHLKTIARNQGSTETTDTSALQDESTAELAQELIIRMMRNKS